MTRQRIAPKLPSQYGSLSSQLRAAGGAQLIADIQQHIRRFVVLPNEHASVVLATWVIHTHLYLQQASTPRLVVTASGKNSGKSILCECLRPLCTGKEVIEDKGNAVTRYGALMAADVTPAYVIGAIDKANRDGERITLIMDEADVEGSSGADMVALRKTINSGYRQSGSAGRVVGGNMVRRSTYAPVIISGIQGNIHETTMSRAIKIHMRPADAEDRFDYYKAHLHDRLGDALRKRIEQWVNAIREDIIGYEPEMEDVRNRDREVWEPLVQIADIAGDEPSKALREAMYFWLGGGTRREPRNHGEQVLANVVAIFEQTDAPAMFSSDIARALADFGQEMNAHELFRALGPFGLRTEMVRIDGERQRGIRREKVEQAWETLVHG